MVFLRRSFPFLTRICQPDFDAFFAESCPSASSRVSAGFCERSLSSKIVAAWWSGRRIGYNLCSSEWFSFRPCRRKASNSTPEGNRGQPKWPRSLSHRERPAAHLEASPRVRISTVLLRHRAAFFRVPCEQTLRQLHKGALFRYAIWRCLLGTSRPAPPRKWGTRDAENGFVRLITPRPWTPLAILG